MATNECTIIVDESGLLALYRWLLALADDDDQPGDNDKRAGEKQRAGVHDDQQ